MGALHIRRRYSFFSGVESMGLLGFTVKKEEILAGKKTCTTRLERKHPPKQGETLYLYWHLRQKDCEKLGEAICERVLTVDWGELQWIIENHPRYLEREGAFTKAEMLEWFEGHYHPIEATRFNIIEWKDFRR
jgi:hypothetical protein